MAIVGQLIPNRELVTLSPRDTVIDAARSMATHGVGAILIAESDNKPLGIFTERDLATRVVVPGKDPKTTTLDSVMTKDLFTTHPGQKASTVLGEMQTRHIRHVPVVHEGHAVGMLSLRDLLRARLAETKEQVSAITAYIQGGLDESGAGVSAEDPDDES